MQIGNKIEDLYKDYTGEMGRLEKHLGAIRMLGLNGIEKIGIALDEIGVTGVAKEYLHWTRNVILLGNGLSIREVNYTTDNGSLRDRTGLCLSVEKTGLLIVRPMEAADYDRDIYVLPIDLPGQPSEFQRRDLRFYLENREFKCESYNDDRDHKRADAILEKLGFSFLEARLATPKTFASPLEVATHLAIHDFVHNSVVTEYQFDELELEKMVINGVQASFEIKKRLAISSVHQRVGPRGFLTPTKK
ncbi:hypothetical protein A2872_01155 [Candidatus Gottesmanbacteria bacterium RIFCSPHIGHO2_01_FULL_42_12]|uniref:Uncharacterized protein n=1 Tax=Candidatus Gottesmanbacteria bacterium RIFCSPHIGHO2_01_FULL_42_12 TaxID=1798377 RepID=A0A1F5Z1H8_9BACT|nr:MAG: hypothetical protein A2872_01155 [Candidatus Gottesmanbacteria bacterium RIFCSPHIGHO2_01_FULL_42_12]